MIAPGRHVALVCLVAALAAAVPARARENPCANGGAATPGDDGIAGTGARPGGPGDDDDGIGGTGIRRDDGVGGTGIAPATATGVIGTVTGFGSICVGTLEIHYGASTSVAIDGRSAGVRDLAVGQVVEVVAEGSAGALHAHDVVVRHVVSGPVGAVDSTHDEITVIGQRVRVPAGAGALAAGTFVEVSGMRRPDGVVVASGIAPVTARDAVALTGPLVAAASGGFTIGDARVMLPRGSDVRAGDEVRIAGRWTAGTIHADAVDALARVPFDGRVAHVDVEGFARVATGGALALGPFRVDLAPGSTLGVTLGSGTRVRIEGRVEARHVVADRIEIMPELPARPVRPDRSPGAGMPGGGGPGPAHGGPPPDFDARGAAMQPPPDARGDGSAPDRPDRPPPPPDRPQGPDVPRPERPPHPPDRPPRPPDRPPGRPR